MVQPASFRRFLRWAVSANGWPALVTAGFALTVIGLLGATVLGLTSVPKSPSGVVQAFYEASNAMDLQAAEAYLAQDARDELRGATAAEQAAFLSDLTLEHTIDNVMHIRVRSYNRRAVVNVLISSGGNGLSLRTEEVIREGAHWKITAPVGTRHWDDLVGE